MRSSWQNESEPREVGNVRILSSIEQYNYVPCQECWKQGKTALQEISPTYVLI